MITGGPPFSILAMRVAFDVQGKAEGYEAFSVLNLNCMVIPVTNIPPVELYRNPCNYSTVNQFHLWFSLEKILTASEFHCLIFFHLSHPDS